MKANNEVFYFPSIYVYVHNLLNNVTDYNSIRRTNNKSFVKDGEQLSSIPKTITFDDNNFFSIASFCPSKYTYIGNRH